MTIVKWTVSSWLGSPVRVEYVKQTAHFYIKTNGGRDSIVCRYNSYFDSETDALAFIEEKKAQRLHMKNIDRIKSHGVELLEALEKVFAVAGDRLSITETFYVRDVIAKAKGEA